MTAVVLSFTLATFLIGAIVLHESGRQVDRVAKRRRWTKYFVYLVIVHLVVGSGMAGPLYFGVFMNVVVTIGAYELLHASFRKGLSTASFARTAAVFGIYLMLAYATVRFAYESPAAKIVFVYLVTATFDGFSQLTGQTIGRRPLATAINPNKTLEGALGGLVGAMLTAFALKSLAGLSIQQAPWLGLILGLAGLTGDLAASAFKRASGIKDFGRILPEHGGVLDRFDSLLVAAPTFFIMFRP